MKIHQIPHRTDRKQKKRRTTKTIFPKETEENADLHKPVLNKVMTKHE